MKKPLIDSHCGCCVPSPHLTVLWRGPQTCSAASYLHHPPPYPLISPPHTSSGPFLITNHPLFTFLFCFVLFCFNLDPFHMWDTQYLCFWFWLISLIKMISRRDIFSKIGSMAFYSFLSFTFIGELQVDRKLRSWANKQYEKEAL